MILISKIDNPMNMKDLCLIALSNVNYKILSKALANHLKRILPNIIVNEQSTFIFGRTIMHNILIASEVVRHLHCKMCDGIGVMALKLDICKAYHRIDQGYLCDVMLKIGFACTQVN